MAGRDRKGIEKQHIVVLVDHYARREGCRFVRQDGDWYCWQCPGCGSESLRANVDWGKAGCKVEGCPVPELESWQGVVGYFEGSEDFEADTERERVKKLKGVALRIVEAYEDRQRRKAEEEARVEADRRREEEEAKQKAEEERTRRMTAQDVEEQRLLDEHRADKERELQQKKEERVEQERRQREVRHENTSMRVLAAWAPILVVELLLAVLIGIGILLSVYYGVGWLDSFAYREPDVMTFGVPTEQSEEVGPIQFSRDQVARISPEVIPWRLPVGLVLGLISGTVVGSLLSRRRREEHALARGELLGLYRYDEEVQQLSWSNIRKLGPQETEREAARRFFNGVGVAVSSLIGRVVVAGLVYLAALLTFDALYPEWNWTGAVTKLVAVPIAILTLGVSLTFKRKRR